MDPGEPSPEEAFEAQMLQKGLFEVQPKHGTLDPQQQIDIEAVYCPSEKDTGEHHLNIFFQVLNGKPLILRFAGQTLKKGSAYLEMRKEVFVLPPTPINLITPITYPLEVKNVGPIKFDYDIDVSPLEDLAKSNHNFNEIFSIPTHKRKKAPVHPNRCEFIYVMFKPIEAKTYAVELPIIVKDTEANKEVMLRIEGTGYHPAQESPPPHQSLFVSVPPYRSNLKGLGPNVSFSLDEVDFGTVDEQTPCRKMVVMYNHSEKNSLNYIFGHTGLVWYVRLITLYSDDIIIIEPHKGKIPPKSHQNIKLTLKASQLPSSYEGELECQISWLGASGEEGGYQSGDPTGITDESLFLRIKKKAVVVFGYYHTA